MRPPRISPNVQTVVKILADLGRITSLAIHSPVHLAAENLFLRKQLALYLRAAGQAAARGRCDSNRARRAVPAGERASVDQVMEHYAVNWSLLDQGV
jgi:hypothetical protein